MNGILIFIVVKSKQDKCMHEMFCTPYLILYYLMVYPNHITALIVLCHGLGGSCLKKGMEIAKNSFCGGGSNVVSEIYNTVKIMWSIDETLLFSKATNKEEYSWSTWMSCRALITDYE